MITRRATWLMIIVAFSAASGCALFRQQGSVHTMASDKQPGKVTITYRTESDRLNVARARASSVGRQISYQDNPAKAIPNVTIGTLEVVYPHPARGSDYALATVVFYPMVHGLAHASDSIWGQSSASIQNELEAEHEKQRTVEKWMLDIPRWQVVGIIAKLQSMGFFRRSRTLDAEAFLAVELDGTGFAKDYRAVSELDALILRAYGSSRSATSDEHLIDSLNQIKLSRLPPVLDQRDTR